MTISADDLTGRNECPLWLRISAVGRLPLDQRMKYMSAAPTLGGRGGRKAKKAPGPWSPKELWERVKPSTFIHYPSFAQCAAAHNAKSQAYFWQKKEALRKDIAAMSFVSGGIEFWFLNPDGIIPGVRIKEALRPS